MINHVFLAFVKSVGMPIPETEFQFHPKRKWRFDFAWPHYKIALEVEGGVFSGGRHTRGVGFINDMEKYNAATSMGWKVLRCTPENLNKLATINLIKTTINNLNNG